MKSNKLSAQDIIASLTSLPKNELSDLAKALARLAELNISNESSSSSASLASSSSSISRPSTAAKAKKSIKEAKAEVEDEEEPVAEKPKKEKKVPAPKGAVPPQLMKNKLWVDFVLEDALRNGWPQFVKTVKGDEIVMPHSILHGEYNIFEGSVTEKTPNGAQPVLGDAMQLSKVYWSAKLQSGTRQDLWELFIEAYEIEEKPAAAAVAPKKAVRRTLEEYNAERAAAKEINDARKAEEKAIAAAERKRISDEKKALKEEQAAQKKAEREAAKAEKDAEKLSKAAKKVPVKAAAVLKASTAVKTIVPVKMPIAAKAAVAPKASLSAVFGLVPRPIQIPIDIEEHVEESFEENVMNDIDWNMDNSDLITTDEELWQSEKDEGDMRLWQFKGVEYWRDDQNIVYSAEEGNAVIGVYCPKTMTIDTSLVD